MGLDPTYRARVIAQLVEWLEKERIEALNHLRANGVALTKRIQRVFAARTHTHADRSGRWELVKTHHEPVERSMFATLAPKYASLCWRPTTPSAFAEDIAGESDSTRKKRELLEGRLLGDYLTQLATPTKADEVLAARLANEYIDYLFAAEILEIEELQVAGIAPPAVPVESSDGMLTVRALTPDELGTNLRRWIGFEESLADDEWPPLGAAFDGVHDFVDYTMGCMISARRKVSRDAALEGEPRLKQIVLALQLMEYSIFGRGLVVRWTEPGPRAGSAPDLIQIPRFPEFEEHAVTTDVLDRIAALADLIPTTFSDANCRSEIALNQFCAACSQHSDSDAIIGFTIALEAVFVPGLLGENSYRFRLNGARYLATNAEERHGIYAKLKELYDIRSKLVHGATPKKSELLDYRSTARRLASRALSKALKNGWPSGKDFEEAALS